MYVIFCATCFPLYGCLFHNHILSLKFLKIIGTLTGAEARLADVSVSVEFKETYLGTNEILLLCLWQYTKFLFLISVRSCSRICHRVSSLILLGVLYLTMEEFFFFLVQ